MARDNIKNQSTMQLPAPNKNQPVVSPHCRSFSTENRANGNKPNLRKQTKKPHPYEFQELCPQRNNHKYQLPPLNYFSCHYLSRQPELRLYKKKFICREVMKIFPRYILATFISNLFVHSSELDTSKFQLLMNKWEKQCTPEQNIILHHRAETFDAELAKNVTIETPWSLNRQSYDNSLEFCADLPQLVDSMQSGKRVFINQNESFFRPGSCNFRWFDASQACEIFSRYALMAYRGDSLARHMTQSTFMILADDVKYAGRAMDIHNAAINNTCVCDGQFSEHRFCKTGYDNAMFHAKDIHKYGLCQNTKNTFGFRFDTQIRKEYYPESKFDFCFNDPRPRLLMLEGGVHVGYDAQWMLNDIIKPVIFDLVVQEMLCEFKYPIHFIWVGADAQSRVLDVKYPKQTRENSNLYNEQIIKGMKEMYSLEEYNLTMINFWNMTKDAPTSDGFHYLTDVNLIKSMTMFNIMDFMSKK